MITVVDPDHTDFEPAPIDLKLMELAIEHPCAMDPLVALHAWLDKYSTGLHHTYSSLEEHLEQARIETFNHWLEVVSLRWQEVVILRDAVAAAIEAAAATRPPASERH